MTTPAALRELAVTLRSLADVVRKHGFLPPISLDSVAERIEALSHGASSSDEVEMVSEAYRNHFGTLDPHDGAADFYAGWESGRSATQLRAAASEGGEAVAWQGRFFDDVRHEWGEWRPMTESEAATYAGISGWQTRPLFTHPPEVARDAGRLDYMQANPGQLSGGVSTVNGRRHWFHAQGCGYFPTIREAIDAAEQAAISGAAGVG